VSMWECVIYIWVFIYECMCSVNMCVFSACMCLSVYSYVGVHVCVCTVAYICGYIHAWRVCVNPLPLCVWLRIIVISDSFVRSELGNERFKVCSLETQYTGDLKTDP